MVDAYPEHVVHVLTVRQDDPDVRAQLERYRALLNPDERAREAPGGRDRAAASG